MNGNITFIKFGTIRTDNCNISNVLINIGGRIGNLMDITQEAIEPSGPRGSNITKEEKQKIFKAVSEVDEKMAKLKLSIK